MSADWDVERLWAKVRARTLDAAPDHGERRVRVKRERPTLPAVNPYAAAAMLIVMAGAAAFFLHGPARPAGPAPEAPPGQYRTSRGQSATIRLIDGSQISLGPESRLTVSATFGRESREIALDGEAVFSVRHDAARPFRVRARGELIEDIGTRFDIRAYPDEPAMIVAVAEGAVKLHRDGSDSSAATGRNAEPTVLHGGEVGTIDPHGKTSTERSARVSAYLDWTSGRLSFVDRPLPEVLRTLGRWYDLDVRVPDARLARRVVTAEFARQSASDVIDALAIAMDATVQRTGRIVTLRPR
jgi:transmembrane sensor